jgi:hypothetical protein
MEGNATGLGREARLLAWSRWGIRFYAIPNDLSLSTISMDRNQTRLYVVKSSDDMGFENAAVPVAGVSTLLEAMRSAFMRAVNHDLLPTFFGLALICGLLASLPAPGGSGSTPPISATEFSTEITRAPGILHAPLTPPSHINPALYQSARGARGSSRAG